MTWLITLAWFVRFVHIVSAICAVGGPFFVRYALLPAASQALDEPTHLKLRRAINARWKIAVFTLIALFLVTGAYNFFVETRLPNGTLITARWKDFGPEDKRMYHMLFGIKVLCAFIIFFLASALAGQSKAFEPIRKHARTSLTLLLLLAGMLVVCSTLLRFLPMHETVVPVQAAPGVTNVPM